jgi:hypothetical protein
VNAGFDVVPTYDFIPFRDIEFNGREMFGAQTYGWDIIEKNSLPLPEPVKLGDGQNLAYQFTLAVGDDKIEGDYKVQYTGYDTNGMPVGSFSKLVPIYKFPGPGVSLNINNRNTIYAGEPAVFMAEMVRTDWPEDLNATFEWAIYHKEPDLDNPGQTKDVIDAAFPAAAKQQIIQHTFNQPGNYYAKVTVTGYTNSGAGAYIESQASYPPISVYTPPTP